MMALGASVHRIGVTNTPEGPGILVRYEVQGKPYEIVWVQGEMMGYDDQPDDQQAPIYVRKSLDGCEWKRKVVGGQDT
jgi:hypothetical protein